MQAQEILQKIAWIRDITTFLKQKKPDKKE